MTLIRISILRKILDVEIARLFSTNPVFTRSRDERAKERHIDEGARSNSTVVSVGKRGTRAWQRNRTSKRSCSPVQPVANHGKHAPLVSSIVAKHGRNSRYSSSAKPLYTRHRFDQFSYSPWIISADCIVSFIYYFVTIEWFLHG